MSAIQKTDLLVNQPQKTSKFRRVAAAVAAGSTYVLVAPANAALDVADLTASIDAQVGNIETIGLAILGVLVVIAGIALLRRIVK